MSKSYYDCRACGAPSACWPSYRCPECGCHNSRLYRAEHAAPDRAARLSRRAIAAEYHAAGLPAPAFCAGA